MIKKATGIQAAIELGATDSFEVFVDDKEIFSRLGTGHFPDSSEIVKQILILKAEKEKKETLPE